MDNATKCLVLNICCAYQEPSKHHFYRKYKATMNTADKKKKKGADTG